MKRLSIIIPVYNVEPFIGRMLTSVFDTTASAHDFEVIIVNDGTKDGSMDIVRAFSNRSNVTVIHQNNQGLSAARMKGLSAATGEFVWFLDSDDALVKDGVGKVLRLLEERPETNALMFPILWVPEGKEEAFLDYELEREMVLNGKEILRDYHLPAGSSQRYVFKRSLAENKWLFFPKGRIHEDDYFGAVFLYLSKDICVQNDAVYIYYQRSGSIMSSLSVRSSNDIVAIHKLLMRFMRENVTAPDDRKWFRDYCYNRLDLCYSRNPHYLNARDFSRFAIIHGSYVWYQWLSVHPEKSLKNKLGRLIYFTLPVLRLRLIGK